MAQPARRPATPLPQQSARLVPVPRQASAFDDTRSAHQILKSLEKISRNGGHFTADPPPKRYGFEGGTHTNVSQVLQENLWRFNLSGPARNLLDHMSVTHNEEGVVAAKQTALAAHFGCSQSKISRALTELSKHHFTWKVKRGEYQLNPTYSYRFSSTKHQALLRRIGAATLKAHKIVIPPAPETRSSS
ncbi:hypothetical protein OG429_40235 (plasmid) [Streptomyces sp. NBC_00190]|uniref:hypothetical protein n=1 Tax=unclassified Streptomyces TaxID=2593676 RepID=UPI002E2AD23D|nr:hypothetical protein [Streptomyces sp. NBC_00190]WSZ45805.1 hypothetical protein OG239_44380 [Streptomyces sp. NBC_00868]